MDKPNERSLHVNPTVRGGGIIFIGLAVFSIPIISYVTGTPLHEQAIWLLCLIILAGISFLDDWYQLSARLRFMIQCLIALLTAIYLRPLKLDFILFNIENVYIISTLIFFIVIWSINHFNFMDGLDGFCASQAVFILLTYAYFYHFFPALFYEEFCLVLVSGILGFLIYNFPPAKLFMGDVGSASLGFIIIIIALIAQQKYQIPFLYWFILNGLFLYDSTITLIRRLLRGEKWYSPHRSHAYQRIKQYGVTSRKILFGQFAINSSILVLIFLIANQMLSIYFILFLQFSISTLVYYLIEKRFPMYQ
jgi:UDP-N-acetylmuramyl pentapeptide phosphotransferase/UDP-N-acetylglucosamine-1-phosphate transferase